MTVPLNRRAQEIRVARELMTHHGATWRDIRAWALTHGYMPADAPETTINPRVVDAWANTQEPT